MPRSSLSAGIVYRHFAVHHVNLSLCPLADINVHVTLAHKRPDDNISRDCLDAEGLRMPFGSSILDGHCRSLNSM